MRSAFPMWWVCYPMSAAGVTFAAGSPISRGFRLLCSDGTLFSLFIILLSFIFQMFCGHLFSLSFFGNFLLISFAPLPATSFDWRQILGSLDVPEVPGFQLFAYCLRLFASSISAG